MSLSSAMNASVSGLTANSSQIATISDNIANSGTYGYKKVVSEFESIVLSANGSTYSAGGVSVGTTRMIGEQGALVSTANGTDLAVQGQGMLPVARTAEVIAGNGSPEMLLTTTGSFNIDQNGYLSTNSGLVLMGWPALGDGTIPSFPRDTQAGLQPILIDTAAVVGSPTTEVGLAVNLPATSTQAGSDGDVETLSLEYYDNLSASQTLNIEFTPTVPGSGSSNEWTMVITDAADAGAVVGEYTLEFSDARADGGTLAAVTAITGGAYDPVAGTVTINVSGGPISINVGELGGNSGFTQLSDPFTPVSITKNGSEVSNVQGIDIDQNGFLFAIFDGGLTQVLYQIPLADLPNENGLQPLDGQAYRPTNDSGDFFLWTAGDGPTGSIASFSLEQSTTDIAESLTDLIATQRSYSSNAKVIQTVDEMLQETTNIKR